jgi:hypothetical protein
MDSEIKALVIKCLDFYSRQTKITEHIDRDELINLVLSKKHHYNSNKGSFKGYFATVAKSYMLKLYKEEEVRIKLVMAREEKLNLLLND